MPISLAGSASKSFSTTKVFFPRLRRKGRKVDASKFTIDLKPAKNLSDSAPKQAKSSVAYLATLKWIEPFATGNSQDLHLEIHAWKDKICKRTYLFFCASSQSSTLPYATPCGKSESLFQ